MSLPASIRWRLFVPLAVFVVVGTYLEFVVTGPPTASEIVGWLVVVPLLLASAIEGITEHPWYLPAFYGMLVGVGVLRYVDGHFGLLTVLFVGGGLAGLVDWLAPGEWLTVAE